MDNQMVDEGQFLFIEITEQINEKGMTIRITPFGNSVLMDLSKKSMALNITKREMTEHCVPPDRNTSPV